MTIFVTLKNNYGQDVFYPSCEKSQRFCKLCKTKTFTQHMIDNIKAMGFEILVKQQVSSL
jgi:hypothetical protein